VGLGRFEGRLVDGHTSVLPQVDLHCRRRAVGSLLNGARWAFVVTKKSKAPPKRSLDGPPAPPRPLLIRSLLSRTAGWKSVMVHIDGL